MSAAAAGRYTLYAYVDWDDPTRFAARLVRELEAFVASRTWSRRTWVVDQRHPPEPGAGPDEPPDRDIGLNHELPGAGARGPGWFDDVAALANGLAALAATFERDFIIGVGDGETGDAEEFHELTADEPDLPRLRQLIEASTSD